jgi:hypothetical protein
MKRLFSEPLLHFLLIGAVLFGVYALRRPSAGGDTIVVSAGRIENLATTFAGTWQRPPTEQELQGLIDNYVADEVLSREAVKLGLDRNDEVIRRRLRQKMEFITEDVAAMNDPTDAELARYLEQHPDVFREEPRYTFQQIFLDENAGRTQTDATALLADLRSGRVGDASTVGDRLMVPYAFTAESRHDVARQFGQGFADQLDKVEIGVWSGPLKSGYGAHLVLVTERTQPRVPPLDEIRDLVEREFTNARREAAQKQFLASLLVQYDVVIEPVGEAGAVEAPGTGSR